MACQASALIWGGVPGTQGLPWGGGSIGPELTPQTWAQAAVLVIWDGEASGSSWGRVGCPSGSTDGGSPWG